MEKELREYIKECNDVLIQNGWKPKEGDLVYNSTLGKASYLFRVKYGDPTLVAWKDRIIDNENKEYIIFLPSLDQLMDIMGDRFKDLYRSLDTLWLCSIHSLGSLENEKVIDGSTRKIACLRAVKEILKEDAQEERDIVMQTRPFVKRALEEEEKSDG